MTSTRRPTASSPGLWWPTLLATSCLLLLPQAGCKKTPAPKPEIRALSWQGFKLGMSQQQARERVEAKGWLWKCTDAKSLMFTDGDGLYSRWLKPTAKARVKRCGAGRKKGAQLGPERITRMQMFFVDDKLIRMNVLMALKDRELMKKLKARLGTPKSRKLTRHAYTSDRVTKMNVWALSRGTTLMMWIRMRHKQELVFLTTDAKQIATLRSITTARKS